ncbi:hypothetical protein [Halotia branconii]|uniref:Uncharacterized protein n=1 Tax=Halotia branconii CENA392 TaxID=1539056 RepID=A0AAJ6NQ94_9CYAN|nr:hypothetical protein [Halotia branconii]WGV24519.1 hypothetical protein QI031_22485 [Halotia branconii CENA392]
MASKFPKIVFCAVIFASTSIGLSGHRPLRALTPPLDIVSSLEANTLNDGEITDASDLEGNELLLLASRNIKEITPASESNVVTDNATRYYITKQSASQRQAHILSYRNIWTQQSNLPHKRKVPEPSVIVGLIAMVGWLVGEIKPNYVKNSK